MDSRHWSELQQLNSDQGLSFTAETVGFNKQIRVTVGLENLQKHSILRNMSFVFTAANLKQCRHECG
jgi:hypothetical protein